MNLKRVAREIKLLSESEVLGKIFDFHSNEDFTLDIIVYGDADSGCYSNVPFYFKLKFPDNYPFTPPELKFVNLNGIRFHPNFYVEGKVCLTILGTWGTQASGPVRSYSPITTVESIIISISSMIHNNPIIEEPGQDKHAATSGPSKAYHLAAKYASLDNGLRYISDKINIPKDLKCKLVKYLEDHRDVYLKTVGDLTGVSPQNVSYFHGHFKIDPDRLMKQLSLLPSASGD